MEKELKSCTGIFLRADLTGHPTHFGRKGLDGRALLGQPRTSKKSVGQP